MNSAHANTPGTQDIEEVNLVALWLDFDRTRWVAGVLAGLFAGIVAIAVAMLLSVVGGGEVWFPVKLMATPILGAGATEYGFKLGALIVGFLFIEVLCAFWGFVYGHFVKTNSLGALLAMGLTWGIFGWIFIWNLFFHAFNTILYADVSAGAAFPVFIAYGVSLTVVGFFDRALR